MQHVLHVLSSMKKPKYTSLSPTDMSLIFTPSLSLCMCFSIPTIAYSPQLNEQETERRSINFTSISNASKTPCAPLQNSVRPCKISRSVCPPAPRDPQQNTNNVVTFVVFFFVLWVCSPARSAFVVCVFCRFWRVASVVWMSFCV